MPAGIVETSGEISGGLSQAQVAVDFDPDNFLKSAIPLKIDFAVIRLPVQQQESLLRGILINAENDLHLHTNKAMVFPFFGRGRFLIPMIGRDINAANINAAAEYLSGACSCQVKSRNPGIDMLSNIDWMSYLEGSAVIIDKALPPLSGTADLLAKNSEKRKLLFRKFIKKHR